MQRVLSGFLVQLDVMWASCRLPAAILSPAVCLPGRDGQALVIRPCSWAAGACGAACGPSLGGQMMCLGQS